VTGRSDPEAAAWNAYDDALARATVTCYRAINQAWATRQRAVDRALAALDIALAATEVAS
jgi:hypothetical protein